MMSITILCVGKLKEEYWIRAAAEYIKRLSKYCVLRIDELKESSTYEEGRKILKRVKKDDYVITLEIEGEQVDSVMLADTIESLAVAGRSKVTFVVGGSEGLSKEVSDRADYSLSFSKMTFPHQMARVILLEQIYRCFTIINNEKYHK